MDEGLRREKGTGIDVMQSRVLILLLVLIASCHKRASVPTPQNSPTGEVASVALGPYQYFSPFTCRMSAQDLTCIAAVDVSFLRGQNNYQIPRGYQFQFHSPKGASGTAGIWFGCAGLNECDSYFMLGSNTVSATPVEPARCWCSPQASSTQPHGSIPLFEVDIAGDEFRSIRPKFSGQSAPPMIKAGPGINVACTALACTVSLK